MSFLFVTGASGFVGRHLLAKLDPRTYDGIYCLSRSEKPPAIPSDGDRKLRWVRGDLANPSTFERELARSDTVVHLAGSTGKARPEEYFRVNVEGTRTLVGLCQQAGVERFLHVSSIAVRYPDNSRYPYAQSKQQAEEIVRQSSLKYAVIRPTMVFGPESPAWLSLKKLARLPVIPIFGNGQARLQPIEVDDLVDFIVLLLQRDSFHRETLEFGGPLAITMEDLLKSIHCRVAGRHPRVVHLPPAALLPLLAILEKIAYSMLPFTVGQLSPFRYNGTIETNALFEQRRTQLKTIDEMLALCAPMNHPEESSLAWECRVFARYLTGTSPTPYILKKYAEAQRKDAAYTPSGPFDRLLLRFARLHPASTNLADAYARLLAPASALRKRLVLLLAILETTPVSGFFLEHPDSRNRRALALKAAWKGLVFVLAILFALLLLFPLHAVLGGRETAGER